MPCGTSRSSPSTAVIVAKALDDPLQLDRGHGPPQSYVLDQRANAHCGSLDTTYKDKLIARD